MFNSTTPQKYKNNSSQYKPKQIQSYPSAKIADIPLHHWDHGKLSKKSMTTYFYNYTSSPQLGQQPLSATSSPFQRPLRDWSVERINQSFLLLNQTYDFRGFNINIWDFVSLHAAVATGTPMANPMATVMDAFNANPMCDVAGGLWW